MIEIVKTFWTTRRRRAVMREVAWVLTGELSWAGDWFTPHRSSGGGRLLMCRRVTRDSCGDLLYLVLGEMGGSVGTARDELAKLAQFVIRTRVERLAASLRKAGWTGGPTTLADVGITPL